MDAVTNILRRAVIAARSTPQPKADWQTIVHDVEDLIRRRVETLVKKRVDDKFAELEAVFKITADQCLGMIDLMDARLAKLEGLVNERHGEGDGFPIQPSIGEIIQAVTKFYGTTTIEVIAGRRTTAAIRPRQVAMYLARTLTTHSTPEIGRQLGGRDHTTVIYGARIIANNRKYDAMLDRDILEIERSLRSRHDVKALPTSLEPPVLPSTPLPEGGGSFIQEDLSHSSETTP